MAGETDHPGAQGQKRPDWTFGSDRPEPDRIIDEIGPMIDDALNGTDQSESDEDRPVPPAGDPAGQAGSSPQDDTPDDDVYDLYDVVQPEPTAEDSARAGEPATDGREPGESGPGGEDGAEGRPHIVPRTSAGRYSRLFSKLRRRQRSA